MVTSVVLNLKAGAIFSFQMTELSNSELTVLQRALEIVTDHQAPRLSIPSACGGTPSASCGTPSVSGGENNSAGRIRTRSSSSSGIAGVSSHSITSKLNVVMV